MSPKTWFSTWFAEKHSNLTHLACCSHMSRQGSELVRCLLKSSSDAPTIKPQELYMDTTATSALEWQSSGQCIAETYFNRTVQHTHTGSHVALANIHNMLDLCPECVPSQVLNLTWFQKGAEVTQRPVWGTNSSCAIKWRHILLPWIVRTISSTSPRPCHHASLTPTHNQTLC